MSASLGQQQVLATLTAIFAGLALALALIGLYSVLAYVVTLWLSGAIEKEQMDAIRGAVLRRLSRFRGSARA